MLLPLLYLPCLCVVRWPLDSWAASSSGLFPGVLKYPGHFQADQNPCLERVTPRKENRQMLMEWKFSAFPDTACWKGQAPLEGSAARSNPPWQMGKVIRSPWPSLQQQTDRFGHRHHDDLVSFVVCPPPAPPPRDQNRQLKALFTTGQDSHMDMHVQARLQPQWRCTKTRPHILQTAVPNADLFPGPQLLAISRAQPGEQADLWS